jgi:hypothetical protein
MLIDEWFYLTAAYPGWTLAESKGLSPRERYLWLGKALQRRLKTRGQSG